MDQAKSLTQDYEAYSKAVTSNQKLWTVMQADLLEETNPQAEYLDALIEINKNIAGGLRDRSKN